MADTPGTLTIVDGTDTPRTFDILIDTAGNFISQQALRVNAAPVATGNPLPTEDALADAALGTPADAAWGGSGNSSVVAALKAIYESSITPTPIVITQTIVTLTAGASTTLIAANSSRKMVRWMNVGTNPMTVAPGTGSVVANQGMNYAPGGSPANQGGGEQFCGDVVPTGAFSAISTLGTTVTVWEGN